MDITQITTALSSWVISRGPTVLAIVAGAFIVLFASKYFLEGAIRGIIKGDPLLSRQDEAKREDTLIRVARGTLRVLVVGVAFLMILSELGVEIGPLLAAAGVAGIAFGFGGQYLIKDLITGLFILLENQYRVGDVVCIGDTCGAVESINLRLTVIRDLDGTVHHIPNGEIKVASNLTKRFSRINLNIGVGYDSDFDTVRDVANNVGAALAQDPEWSEKITKAPEFVRVEEFGDSAVVVKILGECEPGEQWAVAGEYRRRLKRAFDQAGIEIPFPQRVVHAPSPSKKPKRVAKKVKKN